MVTAYLEIVGTSVGTWAWAGHDFTGITTLGNPPSGIAGGYCFLDMVGIRSRPGWPACTCPRSRWSRPPAGLGYDRGMSATLPLDLARYPIDDLDRPAARELIDRCRRQLDETGLCLLPGFLGEQAVARSAADIQAEVPAAYRKERAIQAMNDSEIDPSLPADDPVRTAHRHSMRTIAYDLIDPASPIRALYEWDGLSGFLSEVLGHPVHRCADPLIALMISAMEPGGEQGWHFDDNEFVVSLLLQKPAVGGEFEYVPMIRSDHDPATDAIRAVFEGDRERVQVAPLEPGTLALFRGHRSLHRVSPVTEPPTRLIALLSFDQQPGMVFPAKAQLNNTGRTTRA